MRLRERWSELDGAVKVLLALGGVVLLGLLAIPVVVILAAVIGSFVLGLGDADAAAPETPQVAMNFEYDDANGEVTITHDGGDSLDQSRVRIEVGDQRLGWDAPGGTITAGDSTTVPVERGQSAEVVWLGEEPQVLATFDAPA